MNLNMDFLGKGSAEGQLAQHFLQNGRIDPGVMRPFMDGDKAYATIYKGGDPTKPESYTDVPMSNAVLRRDEWKALDEAVLKISETRLNGIQSLRSRGLVYNLGNAMGSTVLETHDISDALEADLTMDGITRGKNDRVEHTTNYLPLPIIHADYAINARALAASRNLGNALDTSMAERAARKVAEKLEEMLFTSTSYTFGGGVIYGYLNEPHRNQVTLDEKWDNSGTTAREILDDVLQLKQTSIDAKHYGPWELYIPTSYETTLDEDYEDSGTTATGKTIRERILAISGILDIKVVDTLTADNVVLAQMTSDVVRLVNGMGIQNVQWSEEGNMVTKYKVMTIQVPQVRADQEGNSGIVHATFTA